MNNIDSEFIDICNRASLEEIKEYHSTNGLNVRTQTWAFMGACLSGHLDVAQWIYSLGNIDINVEGERHFNSACENDHLDVAEWIDSLYKADARINHNHIFAIICGSGNLNKAQWLYALGRLHTRARVNIHAADELAFRCACAAGKLDVVLWLYSLGKINVHAENEEAFRLACKYGHLNVAIWLHSLGDHNPGKVSMFDWLGDNSGKDMCAFYANIVMWFLPARAVDICADNDGALTSACKRGHFDVVIWLHSLGQINIHLHSANIFRHAFAYKRFDIVKWIHSLDKIDVKVYSACLAYVEKEHMCILNFLLENGADIHTKNNEFFKELITWKNKMEIYEIILPYCRQEHYSLLNPQIVENVTAIKKDIKSARVAQ